MSDDLENPSPAETGWVRSVLWLVAFSGVALWLRWPALTNEAFHNEDAAGIAYNADLILHGYLPLIDNVDMKAPGSFYLAAAAWSVFGRSLVTLQGVAAAWAILAMVGIYLGGRLLYGHRSGLIAALLYVLISPVMDSVDINYGAWMITPYIWSTVAFLAAVRHGQVRWLLLCGVCLAFAGLMKRQAALLFPAFAAGIFLVYLRPWPDKWSGWSDWQKPLLYLLTGLAIGFAPILLWYASQGELVGFLESYAFSSDGWRYVKGSQGLTARLARIGDGFMGFGAYLALPSLLAGFALVLRIRGDQAVTSRTLFLGIYLLCCFIGAALGLRFFKGYYLHVLPAIVWLAAHPEGAVVPWLERSRWSAGQRIKSALSLLAAAIFCLPAAISDFHQIDQIRKSRSISRDHQPQRIAEHIRKNSQPSDRIWVWGRWAWPVYFHADRLAASRYPKTLGVFTTTLTNTWRRPTKNTAFDPASPWPKLIKELTEQEPKFIVLSHNESYRKFKALNQLIRTKYTAVTALKIRGFSIYRLASPDD